jgi:hypothetical protein
MVTMWKMGCVRHMITSVLASQIAVILAAGALIAALLAALAHHDGHELTLLVVG